MLQTTNGQLETFYTLRSYRTNKLNASKERTPIESKPVTLRDYIEVSKPRIVVVLLVTAIASLLAASRFDSTPSEGWDVSAWQITFLALSGALASMGASALNHYYDRDIDKIMERTAKRPIPAGRLSSKSVFAYGFALCIISVVLAFFTLNLVATVMIATGIFFYVIIYTAWLKRTNPSNIVIGGFAGSAASMAGWATATGSIDLLGFLVGWLVFMWTPPHFWCLAIRAREEYASVHVPMLPVLIGNQRTASYILINTAILLPFSVALTFFGPGLLYTSIAAISGSLMLVYHYKLTKNPTPEYAWKAYKVTAPYLVVIFVALALDALFYYPITQPISFFLFF
ncbi:MAG TPA: heme o synthase [Nitrososphaera sp.]|nr:heme o synthase [Nitrososphaera sp.]